METLRIFRDYRALVIATGFHQDRLKGLLEGMGFGRVQTTDQDKQAPALICQDQPELVVTTRNLPVFSGIQLLQAARQDEATDTVPFLILGDKNDLKKGGLAEKVRSQSGADLLAEPFTEENFVKAVVGLLEGTVDPAREAAYASKDAALEALAAGDSDRAGELFQSSLESWPNDSECLMNLAKILVSQEKYEEAETTYFKILEVDNASLKSFLGLAELYEKQGENQLAADVLRQAVAIAQSLEIKGRSKSRIHFYLGEFELRLKRLESAEEAFNEAIQHDPQNPELRTEIGDSYSRHGHYQESEEHYQEALAMAPDMAHTFNRLGIAYRKQGKFDRALELYGKARIRHPEDEHLLFNMARTYYETRDPQKAVALLNEALTLDPEFIVAQLLLTKIVSEQTHDDPDD